MARYFFHLHNDVYVEDDEGRECPSIEDARDIAVSEARTMAASSVREGRLTLSHAVAVTDQSGRQLIVMRFGDAVVVEP